MNKLNLFALLLLAATCACLAVQTFAQESDSDSGDEELDGGFHLRNPVGKSADDIWGLDIHEEGIPKAVDARKRLCGGRMRESQCATCCRAHNKAPEYKQLTFKCTCKEKNNQYMVGA